MSIQLDSFASNVTLHQLQQIQTRIKIILLNQSEYIGSSGVSLAAKIPMWNICRNEGAVQLQDWGHLSTEDVHQEWQYKLTAVMCFLLQKKKKAKKLAKHFAQLVPPSH